jgi:hypothetical protein
VGEQADDHEACVRQAGNIISRHFFLLMPRPKMQWSKKGNRRNAKKAFFSLLIIFPNKTPENTKN